jgi:hypothetical protein
LIHPANALGWDQLLDAPPFFWSRSQLPFLYLIRDADLDGVLRRINGWQFQYRNKLLRLAVGPAVTALCPRMASQIESLNIALPCGFTAKDFFDVFGRNMNSGAIM